MNLNRLEIPFLLYHEKTSQDLNDSPSRSKEYNRHPMAVLFSFNRATSVYLYLSQPSLITLLNSFTIGCGYSYANCRFEEYLEKKCENWTMHEKNSHLFSEPISHGQQKGASVANPEISIEISDLMGIWQPMFLVRGACWSFNIPKLKLHNTLFLQLFISWCWHWVLVQLSHDLTLLADDHRVSHSLPLVGFLSCHRTCSASLQIQGKSPWGMLQKYPDITILLISCQLIESY